MPRRPDVLCLQHVAQEPPGAVAGAARRLGRAALDRWASLARGG